LKKKSVYSCDFTNGKLHLHSGKTFFEYLSVTYKIKGNSLLVHGHTRALCYHYTRCFSALTMAFYLFTSFTEFAIIVQTYNWLCVFQYGSSFVGCPDLSHVTESNGRDVFLHVTSLGCGVRLDDVIVKQKCWFGKKVSTRSIHRLVCWVHDF